jgi:hypothetical protein
LPDEEDRVIKLRGDEVVWQSIENQIVVLDLRTSRYLNVNGSGAVLWSRIVGGATRDELVTALVERYSVSGEQVERDVDSFVGGLAERGLLDA